MRLTDNKVTYNHPQWDLLPCATKDRKTGMVCGTKPSLTSGEANSFFVFCPSVHCRQTGYRSKTYGEAMRAWNNAQLPKVK